ncbi:hypothetical protein K503DRAFT_690929, partial [Rhizopogon vinicolor AM-OR11-026]
LISDAENDGVPCCTSSFGCQNSFSDGFITGTTISRASDGSYIQITGCMDSSRFYFAQRGTGGQMNVRFLNAAQCTFGGYGASFIEQVEPSASRFCLRCCASENDQVNCNSYNDEAGRPVAVPGTYDFPGVSCCYCTRQQFNFQNFHHSHIFSGQSNCPHHLQCYSYCAQPVAASIQNHKELVINPCITIIMNPGKV